MVAKAFFIWGSIPSITKHKSACSWARHSLIGAHYHPSPNTKPKISEHNSPRPNDWSHVIFWTVNKTLMFAHSRLLWLIQVFGYRWCSEIGRLTLLSSDPKRSGSPIWILFPTLICCTLRWPTCGCRFKGRVNSGVQLSLFWECNRH